MSAWSSYLKRVKWHDPRISPIFATDFSKFPKTLLVTAQLDPLGDEGRAFGEKLASHGVSILSLNYKGMIHCFAEYTALLPQARDCQVRIRSFIEKSVNATRNDC